MGFFTNLIHRNQGNWCRDCSCEMTKTDKQLYALPDQMVGHYVEHTDAEYYERQLRAVREKSDIPSGMYACGAVLYRCPECGKRVTKLDPFLPVREEEKHEYPLWFRDEKLDEFLWS